MNRSLVSGALAALFAAALALPAAARELSGVTMPDTVTVGEKTLKLNGMGLRKKAIFKVYVGGLYLEAPSKDAAAILAADAARAIRLQYVRNVDKKSITE
ncbi:MAG TPA: chalcone isomerase family protein, partial [Thermoanaerobaculia bacterium]|nr:chalcone isomerase family protein [Thermoanaerobaculia bacterium]